MKKPDTFIATIKPEQKDSTALRNAASKESSGQSGRSERHDLVDAINQLFAEFEMAYHNQYHKAYGSKGSVGLAKKYWLSNLSRFSPEVILKATRQLVNSEQYMPSLSTMVQACENAMSMFGLPSSSDAYIEACMASEPKSSHTWSHPAVYHAGRATDWYLLATRPESQIYPRFEHHYRQLCQRVLNGESLDLPVVEALPDSSTRPLDPQEQRRRLQALRQKLDL